MSVWQKKRKKEKSLVTKAVILGSSLIYLGRDVAGDVVTDLEKREILSGKEGKDMAEKMRKEIDERGEKIRKDVLKQLGKIVSEMGVATKDDIKKLKLS